jgi:hypothetical protein
MLVPFNPVAVVGTLLVVTLPPLAVMFNAHRAQRARVPVSRNDSGDQAERR